MNSPAPGWHPDPTGRHEHRYWDGGRWTDHVADAGARATDPLDGGGAAADTAQTGGFPTDERPAQTGWASSARTGAPGDEPTWLTDPAAPASGDQPTQIDPTPGGPTQAYPSQGESTQEYPTVPGAAPAAQEWQGGAPPPTGAAGRRPSPALVLALAVLLVAVIGGIAFVLTRDDDDTTEAADRDPTSTDETVDPGQPDGSGAVGDGAGGSGSDDPALPGDLGQDAGSESEVIDVLARSIARDSGGELTHEQAACILEAMVDQVGFERLVEIGESGAANPLEDLTPAQQGEIVGAMIECAPGAMAEAFGEQGGPGGPSE
ncbi:MAG TPA: DUF2510 domain-containing protein [Acidimicrobiales bacterium]